MQKEKHETSWVKSDKKKKTQNKHRRVTVILNVLFRASVSKSWLYFIVLKLGTAGLKKSLGDPDVQLGLRATNQTNLLEKCFVLCSKE